MKDIGTRIKDIRSRKRLTQESFGGLIGVQGAAVSKYEKGDADPGAAALAKIAEFGGISLDWLITGKGAGPGETVNENEPRYQHTLDEHLVATAMATIQQIEALFNQPIRPEKKAKLFCVIYRAEQNNETVRITDLADMLQDAQ